MASTSVSTGRICRACSEKDKIIKNLEDKIELVQKSFREVVAAIKKSQLELHEKDKVINELSKQSNSSQHPEQQNRLIQLENTISEMSKTVGTCEVQRLKDKQLIQTLTCEVEELAHRLITSQCNEGNASGSAPQHTTLFRNRETQTDPVTEHPLRLDANTQTIEVHDVQRSQSKKAELAVVIPTHRPSNVPLDPNFLESPPVVQVADRRISESSLSGVSHSTYLGEIERKEIELAESRLKSREMEVALREIEWKYKMERLRLEAKVSNLEKENQNLLKDKTFQPNLIYVRNVLAKFIKTQDIDKKRIMMNALLTALDVPERT